MGGIKYLMIAPLAVEIGFEGSALWVEVKAGETFDVSIPRRLRWLFDPHDPLYLRASAIHDELLRRGWSRVAAGAVFHDVLLIDGVSAWRRLSMWLGVSLRRYS